jgi:hypothetical protein
MHFLQPQANFQTAQSNVCCIVGPAGRHTTGSDVYSPHRPNCSNTARIHTISIWSKGQMLTVTCPCACQPPRPTGGAEVQLHRFLTCAQLVCQRSALQPGQPLRPRERYAGTQSKGGAVGPKLVWTVLDQKIILYPCRE